MGIPVRKIILQLMIVFAAMASASSFAQPLAPESVELKQLAAMGYEIAKVDAGDIYTVASNGSNKIALTKNTERTAILRFFNRKSGLKAQQESELLKIVNQMNNDLSYQVFIDKSFIAFAVYLYGPHEPKTFAQLIRLIERADTVFDRYPGPLDLLN